jgi:hypothetical protein
MCGDQPQEQVLVLDGPTLYSSSTGHGRCCFHPATAMATAINHRLVPPRMPLPLQELVSRGVTDPARVSVGGHSYGAFMAGEAVRCTAASAA